MKYILIAMLAMALGACGPVEEVEDEGGGNNLRGFGESAAGTIVETNYNSCGTGKTPGISITSSAWNIKTRNAQGLREDTSMRIDIQGRAYFTKYCYQGGRSLVVYGDIPAIFTNSMDGSTGYVEFRDRLSITEEIKEEEFKMVCGIRVDAESLNYAFNGRCLELSRPGKSQKMHMVPL